MTVAGTVANLVFAMVATAALWSALRVVSSRNLVHAIMWLGAMLASTAALFVLLDAQFLAGIQILLYTGGVMTLMIFGVMLTQGGDALPSKPTRAGIAGALAAGAFGLLVALVRGSTTVAASTDVVPGPRAVDLGRRLVGDDLLAFETLSLLLLAAMIGAIVLLRRRNIMVRKLTLTRPPRARNVGEPS